MTAADLMNEFMKLNKDSRDEFLRQLSMWMLIQLPDADHIMLTMQEYTVLHRKAELWNVIKTYTNVTFESESDNPASPKSQPVPTPERKSEQTP